MAEINAHRSLTHLRSESPKLLHRGMAKSKALSGGSGWFVKLGQIAIQVHESAWHFQAAQAQLESSTGGLGIRVLSNTHVSDASGDVDSSSKNGWVCT